MSESTHPYPCPPLEGSNHIRMLHIKPGIASDPIYCTLKPYALGDHLEYEALSYTWGSSDGEVEISCNGSPLSVTRNLYAALQTLRYERKMRTLWVDALCINQRDNVEKTQQIRIMKGIYTRAKYVRIWLGEATESDDRAFQAITKLIGFLSPIIYPIDLASYPEQGISVMDWKALNALLRRPWFTRVWIIQEAVSATECTFICGPHEIPWERLKNVVQGINSLGLLQHLTMHGVDQLAPNLIKMMDRMKLSPNHQAYPGFYDILTLTRETKSTDPRDKIFALMGLVTDLEDMDSLVTPDYSKTDVVQVYTDVLVYLSRRPEFFRVLQLVPHSPHPTSPIPHLPSWVPDWRKNSSRQPFEAGVYSAGGQIQNYPQFSDNHKILLLEGKILDTVKVLADALPDALPNGTILDNAEAQRQAALVQGTAHMRVCNQIAKALDPNAAPYGSRSRFRESFWRALICDLDIHAKKPVAAYGDYFDVFHSFWTTPIEDIPALMHGYFTQEEIRKLALYQEASDRWTSGRRFCATVDGHMGWVPPTTEIGDIFCVFIGAEVPFVLRPSGGHYQLGGECYIHGFMYGEALERGRLETLDITLK